MNSPNEPGSPVSDSSSDTPPAEDIQGQPILSDDNQYMDVSSFRDISNTSAGKRRLPIGGSFGSGVNARDSKSRRREEIPTRRIAGGSGSVWLSSDVSNLRSQKEELVDNHLVERLRTGKSSPGCSNTKNGTVDSR